MRNKINICRLEFDQCGKQGQLLLLSLHKHIFVAKPAQGADNTRGFSYSLCSWKGRSMSGSLSLGEHTTFCARYLSCVFSLCLLNSTKCLQNIMQWHLMNGKSAKCCCVVWPECYIYVRLATTNVFLSPCTNSWSDIKQEPIALVNLSP